MRTFGRRDASQTLSDLPPLNDENALAIIEPVADEGRLQTDIEDRRMEALRAYVMERIDPVAAAALPMRELRQQIEALLHAQANRDRMDLSARDQAAMAEKLAQDMLGYGPLEPLLADDTVDDIMVNGPERVFVERQGMLQRVPVRFRDSAQVASIAQKMAATIGRRIDESSPLVDCRLADGSRVNVVFPPLALDGPYISIRKFARKRLDFQGMVQVGSMSQQVARLLEVAARARLNVLISGGTGSGKTTLLNAMSRMIDMRERIVTIEDAAELQLQQVHVVRMETRPPNLEGEGEVTQRDLVRNALRMRPDRIILGEVRGSEAFDMLQAMNTGHDGSICTVHANTPRDALTRIENMVQMGVVNLPLKAIRTQIGGALDLIVQIERMRDGVRRVVAISDVVGLEGDVLTLEDVAEFHYEGDDAAGRISGRYHLPGMRPSFLNRLKYFGLDDAWMRATQDG